MKKFLVLSVMVKTFLKSRFRHLLVIAYFLFVVLSIHAKDHDTENAKKLLGTLTPYRTCFDVTYYDINIQLNIQHKFLKGNVIINALAVDSFDTLQLDLYNNMKINSIFRGKEKLSYYRKEHAVFVKMSQTIKKGENITLTVSYEGNPLVALNPPWEGGFVWEKDKDGNPLVGVTCEGEGASLWWPNKDHNSDKPDSVSIHATVPSSLFCISNGQLRDSLNQGNGKTTYTWFVSYPINNYNITLYVGKYKLLYDTYTTIEGNQLDLNYYVLSDNFKKAKTHFTQVKDMLTFFEKYFGEYPWIRDGYKLVESPYLGMEHQSAIAYGNNYQNDKGWFDFIILHETAHEWWGNSITAVDFSDIWIHEGFASYCEALYVEEKKGKEAYQNYLDEQKSSIKNTTPIIGKEGIRYFNNNDVDVYMKGSWVLHTLRNSIKNDSMFFDILRTFVEKNKKRGVSSQDFINLVNHKTEKNYQSFFYQYLYTAQLPVLEVKQEDDFFYYYWTNTKTDFQLPIEISIRNKIIVITPTTQLQKIKMVETDTKKIISHIEAKYYVQVKENNK